MEQKKTFNIVNWIVEIKSKSKLWLENYVKFCRPVIYTYKCLATQGVYFESINFKNRFYSTFYDLAK